MRTAGIEDTAEVVEIVLTAHPTQINRRTLQYKHIRIAFFLYNRCLSSHSVFHIVEQHIVVQSLWRAVPRYLRRVSNALKKVHTSAPGYLDLTEPHRTLCGLACTCNPSASEENLRAALSKMGVGGHSMEDVMEKVRNCHYQRFMEPLVMLGLTIQTNTLLTAKTS
ncbi:hypothetical protein IFM89_039951 [Coptis chinensis]|uniref:Phosphoenolpyruvate carboxylase n=1 Tax=Coptis chinensis TaxID=261450 RepID=A0A835GSS2_9MAGN|nr:hypothetical protein IFM89_039951 [Coptis chinensis]